MSEKSRRITVAPGVRRLRAPNHIPTTAWILCAAAFATACARGPASHTIESSRVVESTPSGSGPGASTAERFGLKSAPKRPIESSPDAENPALAWTTPSGWTEMPVSTMRAANFRPAGDERAECYLTLLAGDAGGLAANVNRWRTQLALPLLSKSALDALPHATFAGREGVLVDFTGTWKGMSGAEARDHWRLVGLLLVEPGGSAFLKMTGPDDVIAAERDAFLALARSFRPAGSPAPAEANATATPADPAAADSAAGFTFTMPENWRRAPDRPSRAFSFYAGAGEDLECYVTVLAGEAGGALANVNRWRGQLGLTGLTSSELDALPTLPMLGKSAILVECDGTAASMMGASCTDVDGSVFVKMTGPRDLVKAQRAAFLAFCASLAGAQ